MNEETIFSEKARHYVLCFSDECQLRQHCLRRKLTRYVPADERLITCMNPRYREVADGHCIMFADDRKVRMARGMMHLFDDMPATIAQRIRQTFIGRYSRKIFYSYRKGERLISPAMQRDIADTLLAHGWKKPPLFDAFEENYCW